MIEITAAGDLATFIFDRPNENKFVFVKVQAGLFYAKCIHRLQVMSSDVAEILQTHSLCI